MNSVNILFLIIFLQTIFISTSFGILDQSETESTFNIQFIPLVPSLLLSSKIVNFDILCINRTYNFQLETCVYINDDCISDSFLNIHQVYSNSSSTSPTNYIYQIDIFGQSTTTQKPGCKNITIEPTLTSQFNCSKDNFNGLWKQFNQLNVTCQQNVNVDTFYKYSVDQCSNITGQLNKCSYLPSTNYPTCPFNSILFSGDPFTPTITTYSNGDCYHDNIIDINKLSCSQNPHYQLNCYDKPYNSSNTSSPLFSQSSSILSFLLILLVSLISLF
ncbi:hypothetical protein RB653_010200 [Dictyostelium firmibasis]|uniref:Transmembrane protein n=1 Tax=Dictyostelium firmibasis TaxID=79012 RepID=A0AAN7TSS1_9MYCE